MGMVEKSWPSQPRLMSVGSCCLVGAIEDGTLYVANLGDSRAVLGRLASTAGKKRRAVVAERLSRDHNVADEEVRREVAEAHPDDPHIVMSSHGVWRIDLHCNLQGMSQSSILYYHYNHVSDVEGARCWVFQMPNTTYRLQLGFSTIKGRNNPLAQSLFPEPLCFSLNSSTRLFLTVNTYVVVL